MISTCQHAMKCSQIHLNAHDTYIIDCNYDSWIIQLIGLFNVKHDNEVKVEEVHWILLTKELPVEEGKKNFGPHHAFLDPSPNEKRIGHHYYLLQGKAGRTCQEFSHYSV